MHVRIKSLYRFNSFGHVLSRLSYNTNSTLKIFIPEKHSDGGRIDAKMHVNDSVIEQEFVE